MKEVVVVAVIHAAEGHRDEIEAVIREGLIPGTHAEEGCVAFALHRDTRDPNTLVLIERWADGDALANHLEAPHLTVFREQVGPLSAKPTEFRILEPVPAGDSHKGVLG